MGQNSHFLDLFFNPRSVAIIGASRNKETVNYYLVSNLVNLGFPGKVYPVNPNATEIMGLKAYPKVTSIEGDVDLAVISVPARITLDIVRDCVAKKVKGITIIAGGFSETGTEGQKVQDEIHRLLRENGIRAIGPNALSPINSANNFVVGFRPNSKLPQGGLSFIFQSGLYQPRLEWLLNHFHLNMTKLIDLGNKMDITEVDALEYLAQDEDTTVIAMHLESVAGDAQKFIRILRETTPKKPVLVLKSGRTTAGAKAASSHTAAIIRSSDAVVDAALKQSGAIRVSGLDEFFDLAKAFEYLPLPRGNRVAITSYSGGEGVFTTDCAQLQGLELAELGTETHKKLSEVFPPWEIPINPFDTGVAGQFHTFDVVNRFVEAVVDDPNVDCVAVQVGIPPQLAASTTGHQLLKPYTDLIARGKPVTVWGMDPDISAGMTKDMEAHRIPFYPSAERAVRALGALWRYANLKGR
ncbi:MAG: CoA-binding protein [Dehalococcoidales bacterium]|nr:MAG: CoA-binding protein [Dehalococcoidales bacterium]